MRILYGVQGTGHGHLVRSAAMVAGLRSRGHEVHCLLTGRSSAAFADPEIRASHKRCSRGSRVRRPAGECGCFRRFGSYGWCAFLRDVRSFDASGFDLVLTDYEPVSAWIARRCTATKHRRRPPLRIPPASATAGPDRAGTVDAADVRSCLHGRSGPRSVSTGIASRRESAAHDQSRPGRGGEGRPAARTRTSGSSSTCRRRARRASRRCWGACRTHRFVALPAGARAGRARQRLDPALRPSGVPGRPGRLLGCDHERGASR